MSNHQSSQVLNQRHDEKRDFPQFSLLPWELRNQVWQSALRRRRLIRGYLREPQPGGFIEHKSEKIPYRGGAVFWVEGFQILSKLLRVSSEARNAALAFYRVHLPCVLSRMVSAGHSRTCVGILPFNPEHDILWFRMWCRQECFVDFISTLHMYPCVIPCMLGIYPVTGLSLDSSR
jgi:hypothetical protein